MTIQLDQPTAQIAADTSAARTPSVTGDADLLFVGGWNAALTYHQAAERVTIETGALGDCQSKDPECNIFASPFGLSNKVSAYRARRRLNRTFRRNQAEFDNAMNVVAHDPAGQREIQAIWTSRP